MKKTKTFMHTAAFFAVVAMASACSNDEDIAKTQGGIQSKDMTLAASFPTTRVGFDTEGNGYWHSGDDIAVWSATEKKFVKFENQAKNGSTTATFKGTIVESDLTDETVVLYPYSESHTSTKYSLPSSYEYASVDEDYTATDGTQNSFRMPMKGTISIDGSGTKTVNFSHIGGVLAIKVDELPSAKGKVTVTASNWDIYGSAKIGTEGIDTPDGGREVSFSYEGATAGKSGVFYLPMAPATYNLTIKVYDENNTLACSTSMSDMQIECGHIKKFVVTSNGKVINGHKFVDLGLPSGLLWAETNIGAATAADYGKYYAWGEVTAYKEAKDWGDKSVKTTYNWENYKYGTSSNITRYNGTDGLSTLDASDDAATVNWGSSCHMPTTNDYSELRDNCTLAWTSKEDSDGSTISGFELKSKNNGKSIFLPASGYRNGSGFQNQGTEGRYWLNSHMPGSNGVNYAIYFNFYSNKGLCGGSGYGEERCNGYTVRPVAKP